MRLPPPQHSPRNIIQPPNQTNQTLLPTPLLLLLLNLDISLTPRTDISIASLGTLYAKQTGDRSLCTRQDNGSEYCTCIYECGNGVWSHHHQGKTRQRHYDDDDHDNYDYAESTTDVKAWTWEQGCGKYCHAGVCDGQV